MSASSWLGRARGRETARAGARERGRDESTRVWIGVDLSDEQDQGPPRALLPLLILALIVALGVAALRIDLIRTRYAVSATLAEEEALLEEQRALIVRRRQLRDPVELAIQARARGFRPPAHVILLPDPARADAALRPSARPSLPAVAARRAEDAQGGEWE